MGRIRVLVVDDSVVVRRLVPDELNKDPDIEVIAVAANGSIAIAKLAGINPDLVLLDVEMPVMDGCGRCAPLRKTHPRLPVIMFSTLTEHGAGTTLDALSLGASDYMTKPTNVSNSLQARQLIREELIPKIKHLCHRAAPFQRRQLRRPVALPRPRPRGWTSGSSSRRLRGRWRFW